MHEINDLSRVRYPNRAASLTFAITFAWISVLTGGGCLSSPIGSGTSRAALRVGTSGDYRPFSYATAASEAGMMGFSINLGTAYAEATGREIVWVPFAWPSLAEDLAARHFDLALSGVTLRADRSIAGRFSLPVTVSGTMVLVRADGELQEAEALTKPGLVFAVNAGGHLERTARSLFPEARIVPIPDNGSVLDRLSEPGIDAVVTDSLEAPHWLTLRPGLRAHGPLTRDRKAAWFPIGADAERARLRGGACS